MTIEAKSPVQTDLAVLESIERRVVWLAMTIVHHANRVQVISGQQAQKMSRELDMNGVAADRT